MSYGTDGLTFNALRGANKARLPHFKNKHGALAHSKPDGSDWSPAQWLQAVVGELGEYANIRKKFERGDLSLAEFSDLAGKELADVQTYLDILAQRCLDTDVPHPHGVDLGKATIAKFNEVSARVNCAPVRLDVDGSFYPPGTSMPSAPAAPGFTGEHHKLDTEDAVFFYEQDFYVLSNFSSFSLYWKGGRFDTSEAAYHWEKFPNYPQIQSAIAGAFSAHDAFKLAEQHKPERRPDWDSVKVEIMREILRAKADQHEYVKRKLLATGDRLLVEDSWRDDFWGWGADGNGKNMLGKLWMEIRAEIRAAA